MEEIEMNPKGFIQSFEISKWQYRKYPNLLLTWECRRQENQKSSFYGIVL